MLKEHSREFWIALIQIMIDLSNLIEQLAVYFMVKQDSTNNKYEERLFFFVLLIIGLLSNLPSASSYLNIQTIGSITIEFGELLAYMLLLNNSTSFTLFVFISFLVEAILHSMHIILEYNSMERTRNIFVFSKTACGRIKYVFVRSISYTVFNATSILFLFLDDKSRFHNKFYEILILLTFYFPSIALGPALESTARFKHEFEQGQIPRITLFLVWSLTCATLYYLMYCIPLSMTGIVFAIQELREIAPPYGYDFVVYVSSLVFFSTAILIFPRFMFWWWRFTYQRFKAMRMDAIKRLKQTSPEDSPSLSLNPK